MSEQIIWYPPSENNAMAIVESHHFIHIKTALFAHHAFLLNGKSF